MFSEWSDLITASRIKNTDTFQRGELIWKQNYLTVCQWPCLRLKKWDKTKTNLKLQNTFLESVECCMLCRIYFGLTEREIWCGLSRVWVTRSCHFPGAPTTRRIPWASKRWLAFVLQPSNAISIVKRISSSFTPLEIKIETPPMPTEFQSHKPPHAFGIPRCHPW